MQLWKRYHSLINTLYALHTTSSFPLPYYLPFFAYVLSKNKTPLVISIFDYVEAKRNFLKVYA
jgi:hypothetical protein